MNAETRAQFDRLTRREAAELSKMLEEKWGVTESGLTGSDVMGDFILPLLSRYAERLGSPADHLADLRRRLARTA